MAGGRRHSGHIHCLSFRCRGQQKNGCNYNFLEIVKGWDDVKQVGGTVVLDAMWRVLRLGFGKAEIGLRRPA